jgi:hypothetical protein
MRLDNGMGQSTISNPDAFWQLDRCLTQYLEALPPYTSQYTGGLDSTLAAAYVLCCSGTVHLHKYLVHSHSQSRTSCLKAAQGITQVVQNFERSPRAIDIKLMVSHKETYLLLNVDDFVPGCLQDSASDFGMPHEVAYGERRVNAPIGSQGYATSRRYSAKAEHTSGHGIIRRNLDPTTH